MHRAVVLVCLLVCAAAGSAAARASSDFTGHHRQVIPVVVVRGLSLADLPGLAQEGAVGLLVPNAGPRTSAGDAFAGMVRGVLYNARLPRPHDFVLIHVTKANKIPRHGPLIVVGLPPERTTKNGTRYPIAVLGPGWHGTLSSSLTRVPGLVSMADVARTALQTPHALHATPSRDAAASVLRLESRIEVARSSALAATLLVLGLLVAFALFFPSGAPSALGAALAANLALGWAAGGSTAPRLALLGLCTVAGGILGARFLRSRAALGAALVGVLAAYAVVMAVHPWALSLAPLGPELTSRFYGVSNLLETLLLVPALLGAKLLGERFGPFAFGAVALLALTTIAENRLGDDGGGALVVAVAFAVLAVTLSSARLAGDRARARSGCLGRRRAARCRRGVDHVRPPQRRARRRSPRSRARGPEPRPALVRADDRAVVSRLPGGDRARGRDRRDPRSAVAARGGGADRADRGPRRLGARQRLARVGLARRTHGAARGRGRPPPPAVVLPLAARLGVDGGTPVGRPRPQE